MAWFILCSSKKAVSAHQLQAKPVNLTPFPFQMNDLIDDTVFYRGLDADPMPGDESSFQVRMSSEVPCEQVATEKHEILGIAKRGQPFLEILSHEKADVDLSRFAAGNAPLLDEHKDTRHLGWINRAMLSKDKAVRGIVTFDNITPLSQTRRQQVGVGSRPNFSIGYKHTRYLGKTDLPDGKVGHRFAWQALEESSVAVPADPTARVNRAAKENVRCHCISCGDEMERSELNDNFMCEDCVNAETPMTDLRKTVGRMGRSKTISHEEVRNKVYGALDKDSRFKTKDSCGNTRSDFAIHAINQVVGDEEDGTADEFHAIVSSPAYGNNFHRVPFEMDDEDGSVDLGESEEVQPRTVWESMEHGLTEDGRMIRKDSKKPYGDVKYADNGLQKDGKKRYPIDTKEHAKAALSYISMPKNKAKYSAEDYEKVKGKIVSACKKFGIDVSDEKRAEPNTPDNRILVRAGNFLMEIKPQIRRSIKVGDALIAVDE
jgi:hypothetical protein